MSKTVERRWPSQRNTDCIKQVFSDARSQQIETKEQNVNWRGDGTGAPGHLQSRPAVRMHTAAKPEFSRPAGTSFQDSHLTTVAIFQNQRRNGHRLTGGNLIRGAEQKAS
jgi:hypothetical protein